MSPPGGKVCLGTIVGAQGVKGQVRIKSETEVPEDVGAYGPLSDEAGTRTFDVAVERRSKGVIIARIKGVEDRNAAEALKGVRLYVERDVLPPPEEEEFYHADLIGLSAETVSGEDFGRIRAVHEFGAGDVLELTGPDGKGLMVPFTRAAVPEVDIEGGKVVIDPPPGLLEPGEPEPKEEE